MHGPWGPRLAPPATTAPVLPNSRTPPRLLARQRDLVLAPGGRRCGASQGSMAVTSSLPDVVPARRPRPGDGEPACRRDSVQLPRGAWVAIHLSGLPGEPSLSGGGRAAHFPRLALLRVGFTEPEGSPSPLVRSYRTLSPLPVRARRPAIGGFLSVALSCGSPRLAVSQHPALWSPDLPRHGPAVAARAAATWPTHRHRQLCHHQAGEGDPTAHR